MTRRFRTPLFALILALLIAPGTRAQTTTVPATDKLAQTGFKFLQVPVHARIAAMGDATTALENSSSVAMFYNPANMAYLNTSSHASFGLAQWIADISYYSASVAHRPADGRYGVFGLSVISVSYGDILGTVIADNEKGYLDYSEMGLSNPSPSGLAFGLGYANGLTDRIAVGANVKYARQALGASVTTTTESGAETQDYNKSTVVFDFGIFYRTGFQSLNFAMSARNFSQELQYAEENFELPLSFQVGVAMNVLDFTEIDPSMHRFDIALSAERPRDFAEQVKMGGEYTFFNTLSLRGGYLFPTDEQGINLGAGLQLSAGELALEANYAYTRFGIFGNVNRVAVDIGF